MNTKAFLYVISKTIALSYITSNALFHNVQSTGILELAIDVFV